jgi:soluble lytic murein transglycosylase-like protein
MRTRRTRTALLPALAAALAFIDFAAAHPRYTVRWGDTLTSIAATYRTSPSALARINDLSKPDLLLAGTQLHLPEADDVTSHAEPWSIQHAIDHWSTRYGVDPDLVRALAWMESGYQSDVASPAGAWGPMQVTPGTWIFVEDVLVGASVARTAEGNVRVGIAYLDHLLHQFGGNERLAVGAYYQGAAAVSNYGLFPATRAYVADVFALRGRV